MKDILIIKKITGIQIKTTNTYIQI